MGKLLVSRQNKVKYFLKQKEWRQQFVYKAHILYIFNKHDYILYSTFYIAYFILRLSALKKKKK